MQRHTGIWICTEKNTSFSNSYSILFTLHCFPTQSTLKLLSLWTLLSTFPLFIILPTSFVLSSSWFRQNIELHSSCISLHRAAQTQQPVFFPIAFATLIIKKTNFRCSGTLCYTFVALIKEPIIEQALQLSVKVLCCWQLWGFFLWSMQTAIVTAPHLHPLIY